MFHSTMFALIGGQSSFITTLNPIEHLWHYLKVKIGSYENRPTSIHSLWQYVAEEWNKISVEVCQKLIETMPKRIQAVIEAKGGHTKY